MTSAVNSHGRTKRNDKQCGFTSAPEVVQVLAYTVSNSVHIALCPQIYVPESKTYLQPVWLRSEVCVCRVSIVAVVHSGGFRFCMVH